jgi:hypothetical protein
MSKPLVSPLLLRVVRYDIHREREETPPHGSGFSPCVSPMCEFGADELRSHLQE